MYSRIGIVIPAYNETKNLEQLVPQILSLYKGIRVVIVDDSEESESKRLARAIKRLGRGIRIIMRGKKSGRGGAVREGMIHLMSNPRIDFIIEMDADLAHKPEEILLLLNKKDSADLVIGSRYLNKSSIIRWPLRRRIQSKLINAFLRIWLGLNIRDFTNGFRLYSRRAADTLLKANLRETGYIALSEMAYVLKHTGCTIREVPTTFTDRTYGKSNADTKELIRSLIGAIRTKFVHK